MKSGTFRVLCIALTSLFGAAVGGGCAAKKPAPPLVGPGARVELTVYSGSALSGPTTQPVAAAADADQAWVVDVSFVALKDMPRAALRSVGAQARLITATQGGQPVLPSTRLTAASRCALGDEAEAFAEVIKSGSLGPSADIAAKRAALLPGMTVTARGVDAAATSAPAARWSEIAVSRPAGAPAELQLALLMQDLVTPAAPDPDEQTGPDEVDSRDKRQRGRSRRAAPQPAAAAAAPQPVLQRELAVVDRVPVSADGATAAFVVPTRLAGSGARAVAAIVRVAPASSAPDAAELVDASMKQVGESIERERARTSIVSADVHDSRSYRTVLDSLASPEHRRRSLVYLSDQTGASICLDVAMVADDATLEELSTRVGEATSAAESTAGRDALGWALDRAALALLTARSGTEKVPDELAAVLVAHAGEAGRHSGSLEEVLAGAATKRDLDARLVAENYIFLEDNSPASRVRAYDWLRARGRAPEGYNPLGPNRERRDALERALAQPVPPAQPAAATAANGGQP